MNVPAGRKVHHRIGAPLGGPAHLLNYLLDTGSHGTVANVSVNFYQKVAPDDHRFALWMVDVGGNDRAAASDFRAHELGGDRFGMLAPKDSPRFFTADWLMRAASRPRFSRMAINSISGV